MNLIVIQARQGSKRFPKKTTTYIGDYKLLEWVVLRLKMIKNFKKIVLATTYKKEDGYLKVIAKKHNIDFFQGDENNLLKRFFDTSRKYNIENIVRICADNPFICPKEIDLLIKNFNSGNYKYLFNNRDYKNFKFADGFGAEIFTISLLRFMFSKVYSLEEKEHVTSYLWNKGIFLNPGSSLIANFSRNISIDINNKTDYKKINYYVKKFRLIPKDKTSKIISIFSRDNYFLKHKRIIN
jgi:spore coat polysaccharide biosynthesis protein SpsF